MENNNIGWKVWGIVAFVAIGFLVLLLIGSYNAVYQLQEYSEELIEYYDGCFVYPEGTTVISNEDYENCLICSDNAVAVCMYPEDYEEIYG